MNILLVHNYYQIPGGEDTVVANERELLEDKGHNVVLYCRHNLELKNFGMIQKLLLPFTTLFSWKTYQEVKQLIKAKEIEIVHTHNTLSLISPSVYYAAFAYKVPVVQTVHNFRLLCPGATFYRDGSICQDCVTKGLKCAVKHSCYRGSKLQTLACVLSTGIHRILGTYGKLNYICLTDFNKEILLNLKQIKATKVFVKPNFVDSKQEIIPFGDRKHQVVFAGRIDNLKGVKILLKAWRLLGVEAPELVICGTGPMEEWCQNFIEENGMTNVKMLGFVPNEQTKKIIAESKALILPTQWYEGFPMTIVESFAVGTAVIGSAMGNVGILITDGINGMKFKQDSPVALVEAVHTVINTDMVSSTTRTYSDRYTALKNYNILIQIYETVMQRESVRGNYE